MRALKLDVTNLGETLISDISEYVFGFEYLFIKKLNGETLSIDRDSITAAYRKYKDRWIAINMRTSKKK